MSAVYFMEDVTKISFVNVLLDGMENSAPYRDVQTIVKEMESVHFLLTKSSITS